MAAALIASHAQLLADAQAARQEKKLYSKINPCGGEDEKTTREWVREIDAAERQVPGAGLEVALVTARGELKRTLLGLVEAHPNDQPQWGHVRPGLVRKFVSADEERRAFTEMMGMRRYADETLAVFWRRFQVALREALPQLQEGDLRRSVIPALAQAAGNDKLARRLFALRNFTLVALTAMVEDFVAVEEQMTTIKSKAKRSINQVSESVIDSITTTLDRLSTRMAKLEARGVPHGGTPKGRGKGRVICYGCGEAGHFARDCQKAPGDSRRPGAQSSH